MAIEPRDAVAKIKKYLLDGAIWEIDTDTWPRYAVVPFDVMRSCAATVRDLTTDGQLNLRAMSLVYTTLLSLVPLLAISFSVLKGFGVHNQVEPFLQNLLQPLGDKGLEISDRIIEFVENVKAGVLGSLGLGLLIFTVISLMQKIERAFNFAWHVNQHRSLAQRFSGYLSVIVIGPLLIFSSIGITTSIQATSVVESLAAYQTVGTLLEFLGKLVPYCLIIAAFTFIYIFMPNTRVRVQSAFVGALVAGFLWESMGWVFASFVVNSVNYTAIYSAFATLIVFLLWLYLGWLILLAGASIAFYHQHPDYRSLQRGILRLSIRVREKLALLVMHAVGENMYANRHPWTAGDLARRLGVPVAAVELVVGSLEAGGLLAPTADEPPAYLPAKPLDETCVGDVLDTARSADEISNLAFSRLPASPSVDAVLGERAAAADTAVRGRRIKDLSSPQATAKPPVTEPVPIASAPKRRGL